MTPENFIRTQLVPEPLSFRPDISLYRTTPKSGLRAWLAEQGRADIPPYWAYAWAGGAVLSLHLRDNPQSVAGRKVLDFGSGSGLVGIAAAKAGALVTAFEPDPIGRVATALNAQANGVDIAISQTLPDAEIVLAGDVFYDAAIAALTLPLLEDLARRGALVLIGDPFRRDLPVERLDLLAEYAVPDMGGARLVRAGLFALRL